MDEEMEALIMSYALRNAVYASGIETLTVPGSGGLTTASISVAGIAKATDTVLISFNWNAQATVTINQPPYIVAVSDGSGFDLGMNLDNPDPAAGTCFLEWAVLR